MNPTTRSATMEAASDSRSGVFEVMNPKLTTPQTRVVSAPTPAGKAVTPGVNIRRDIGVQEKDKSSVQKPTQPVKQSEERTKAFLEKLKARLGNCSVEN